ncbi:MAG: hypothetical protein A2X93_06015 [Deltaproteobacteria bacterium GWC2_56_8]|nr:MAG: hypothetical protein A2X93_06015 [Deltaproteobacteria bacterium GWC2_56_8]
MQKKNRDNTYTAFDWARYDRLIENAQAYNIHISAIIIAREPLAEQGQRRPPSLPADLKGYQSFVRALVERYDGDGKDDKPGLLYPIKNWKIEDEAMAKIYFNGTPSDYARLVNAAYDAIKQSDSGANVILAMVRGYDAFGEADPKAFMEGFFSEFARLSRGRKWDTIDQHSMIVSRTADPEKQYLEIGRYVEDVKAASKRYGFEPAPFWAMEVAGIDPPPERAHAIDLFKRYVYAFSVGVRKVFWSGLAEKPPQSTSGIKDPLEKATLIDSHGQKKLAYYTYKKMVSMLDGFDVNRVETIKHDGVYVFRFSRDSKPVWVAWNDFGPVVREKLSVPRGARVTVVEAVPDAGTGAEIRDYANAFRTIEGKAMSGVFEFEIGATPLIITVD